MSVVSYKQGREQTHNIAPPPDTLAKEMDAFLSAPEHLDTAAGRMWTAGKLRIFSQSL
jgi:hypothetical protein